MKKKKLKLVCKDPIFGVKYFFIARIVFCAEKPFYKQQTKTSNIICYIDQINKVWWGKKSPHSVLPIFVFVQIIMYISC